MLPFLHALSLSHASLSLSHTRTLHSMGLHLEALHTFLDTPGVTASGTMRDDRNRNPLHCLSAIWIFGDSLKDSLLIHLLGGKNTEKKEPHWLEQVGGCYIDGCFRQIY